MSNSDQRAEDIAAHREEIYYSSRYSDDENEYRHVTLPKQIARWVPEGRLMSEEEWRDLGVQQSAGWEHYMIHAPEPHILLFRREKDYQLKYPNGKPKQSTSSTTTATKAGAVGGLAG
ncbi:cyclin-dependent kinase regulatory subunit 1 [Spizellomyces punctatus DAOM BR117]|uniref:Cyclin-dependent kinases regulatory subunit n=1 Tax=Spizellomyces punctatus (strain DAOM BR117) TaxID=645134 RepID=A0A0L0HJB5_SPIPD|nr:cyclin-dependent kinase regulatory subunit 1 [Spizellomyces punctatus DAOM BR117]KND00929.1 cyclin-dependent kinase regulatory subunit 1 [Spizellomyces punctatus DAOM BR117]|eukprot:XP_016608968.1 cyclin-dependent kinase regulatory subunit 1 [Spizellomyces punctatus DAOM BR117]